MYTDTGRVYLNFLDGRFDQGDTIVESGQFLLFLQVLLALGRHQCLEQFIDFVDVRPVSICIINWADTVTLESPRRPRQNQVYGDRQQEHDSVVWICRLNVFTVYVQVGKV